MATYDWDETQPSNDDFLGDGASDNRLLELDIRERMELDHAWAEDKSWDGEHNKVTLRELASDPINEANKGYLYTKETNSVTELFWLDEDVQDNVVQFTSAGKIGAIGTEGLFQTLSVQDGVATALTPVYISDEQAGIIACRLENPSTASANVVGAIYTVVQDNGYWGGMGMTGSGSTIGGGAFVSTLHFYNQGYGDTLNTIDGAKDFAWYSDPTNSHNFSALTNEIMRLSYLGVLTTTTGIVPDANDGAYLGTLTESFSDLFLATGGTINWENSDYAITHSAGYLTFSGGTVIPIINGGVVFNEPGADVDFRVESNTDTHALFIDGANSSIGVGTSAPNSYNSGANNFVIYENGNGGMSIISPTDGVGSIAFGDGTGVSAYRGQIQYAHVTDNLTLWTTGNIRQTIDSSGNVGLGVTPTKPFHLSSTTEYPILVQGNNYRNVMVIQSDFATGIDGIAGYRMSTYDGSSVGSHGQLVANYNLHSVDPDSVNLVNLRTGGDLIFKTENTERVRVDSSGDTTFAGDILGTNVGISATSTSTRIARWTSTAQLTMILYKPITAFFHSTGFSSFQAYSPNGATTGATWTTLPSDETIMLNPGYYRILYSGGTSHLDIDGVFGCDGTNLADIATVSGGTFT